jgi:cytosine/adenosine deaminase-related metal-dependent hydrolase
MRLLIAKYVVPVSHPVIERGGVLFDNERIVAVGDADELRRQVTRDVQIEDLGDVALLPGFVNPHTHLELTCYHGLLESAPLWQWFNGLLPMRLLDGARDRERAGVTDGARLCIESGVTTVGDISRTGLSAELLSDSPIRTISFVELISGAALPPSTVTNLVETVEGIDREFGGDRLIVGVSPHTPYTVTPDDLIAVARYASSQRRSWTMHLLETPEEAEWLDGRRGFLSTFLEERKLANAGFVPSGIRKLLEPLELAGSSPLFAHVNYATDDDIDAIAECGASVVWCPRAHAYYGHENHPWRRLIERGINVCIGTDSLASNESLSILDELRFLGTRFDDVPSEELLQLGTIRSATALGLTGKAGCLQPGAWSDFCVLPTIAKRASDVIDQALYSNSCVAQTWIGGERVFAAPPL